MKVVNSNNKNNVQKLAAMLINEVLQDLDLSYEELMAKFAPKTEILTAAEKEYLSAVIKPYKDRVGSVTKLTYPRSKGYFDGTIVIIIRNYDENKDGRLLNKYAYLPFTKGEFIGMKKDVYYTLEELNL